MHVPFLSIKRITEKYSEEFHECVKRVVDSGWYLQGEELGNFERSYASFSGVRHAIGVANGLDALALILRAYIEKGSISPGDEVVVPANTYIASILAITGNGLVPKLVEPRLDTYQIDDSLIEGAIGPKTKAVMIVHLYGRCSYSEKVKEVCDRHGLFLIEDNAQAHGCLFNGRRTGSLGDSAGHSFYPGKNLGAFGDAGAVTTDDDELADIIRMLANYGSKKKYECIYKGRNSRLDEVQAAVLGVKLRHLDDDNELRKEVARGYLDGVSNPLIALPEVPDWNSNVFHIFPVRCPERDRLQRYLAERDIQTIIHYPIPPHKQECYRDMNELSLPITERIHAEELSIPISQVMTGNELEYVVEALNGFK